jgi:hypothetical protein
MKKVLENYNDKSVISLVKAYIKKGRLTLSGDKKAEVVDLPEDTFTTKNRELFTKHNDVRIVNDKSLDVSLKDIASEVCEEVGKEE